MPGRHRVQGRDGAQASFRRVRRPCRNKSFPVAEALNGGEGVIGVIVSFKVVYDWADGQGDSSLLYRLINNPGAAGYIGSAT